MLIAEKYSTSPGSETVPYEAALDIRYAPARPHSGISRGKADLSTALIRAAEPIALTSIFPYAWRLVLHFDVGRRSDASFYAGVLISAFSFAESLTGFYWGGLSDRIGRKPVLLFGCAGTALSLLLVGFSTSFQMALAARMLGGLLNGNMGVIQTMVGELVTNPKHERKGPGQPSPATPADQPQREPFQSCLSFGQ